MVDRSTSGSPSVYDGMFHFQLPPRLWIVLLLASPSSMMDYATPGSPRVYDGMFHFRLPLPGLWWIVPLLAFPLKSMVDCSTPGSPLGL